MKYVKWCLAVSVCLVFSTSAFGWVITDNGLVRPPDPAYVPFGSPGDLDLEITPTGSYATWWHDGGPPYSATIPNDDCDVFPDKNHHVTSWADIIVRPSIVDSYMRRIEGIDMPTLLPTVPYGDIFGDHLVGAYQPLLPPDTSTDPPHVFPDGTQGTPLHILGDNLSGVVFYDVKDEFMVQFFSCDKNDGYMEVVLNGTVIDTIDTWCQGWWYLTLSGLDPNVPDTVMLRTRYDNDAHSSIPSPHINTLDLNGGSENWWHLLPGDEGYPAPDDFHIFYVAYNYIEVPEPATLMLMGTGLAVGAWWRRRRRRTG